MRGQIPLAITAPLAVRNMLVLVARDLDFCKEVPNHDLFECCCTSETGCATVGHHRSPCCTLSAELVSKTTSSNATCNDGQLTLPKYRRRSLCCTRNPATLYRHQARSCCESLYCEGLRDRPCWNERFFTLTSTCSRVQAGDRWRLPW